MADLLTVDVIDRPAGGVVRAARRLHALSLAGAPGLRAVIQTSTGRFVPRIWPEPTVRRIGVVAAWDPDADVEASWGATIGSLAQGAHEHWHVRGELTRAAFTEPWQHWSPDTGGAEPHADDEPALVLISGNLRARALPAFVKDAKLAVAHAFEEPGYLGGLAINSSPLNTTSCSAWRTYADVKRYAYAPGRHAEAMKRDRRDERHRTEWFSRIRPLEERGTLEGKAVFADVLAAREPASAVPA